MCSGRPSRRSARASSSRPFSMASSRRSRENHWRILLRARVEATIWSQSRDGPAVGDFEVKISTVSALAQLRLERHQAAVDPRPDAAVAHLGVDGVGEVDRRRAGRQRDDLALGREDVDLVLLQVELQRLEELDRVVGLAVDVGDALEPRHLRGVVLLGLVAPVGRDAVLGPVVHLRGPDLHLDRLAVQPDHRRVQRLVHVELGRVDVVLEAPVHRGPDGVDGAQRGPAVLLGLDDDPDGDQVVDVVELLAPHDHLLVDGPQVLRPPGDVGHDAHVVQALAHVDEHPLEVLLALRRPGRHHLLDLGVALRVQRGEGEVLELPAHLLHPEPVGQRRVDVEGLLRRAPLLPLGHDGERAHVVQPVGQLDQQDAPVVGHGDEHLADGGRLLRLLGVELEPVELGHAVDDAGHPLAEGLLDRLERQPGVLHGVVQEGGGHGLLVEAELGHDRRHGDRVRDVGLARAPELPLVGPGGGPAGLDDHGGVVLGAVAGELGQQRGQQVAQHRLVCLLRLEVSSVRPVSVSCRMESPASGPPSIQATRQGKCRTHAAACARRRPAAQRRSAQLCACACSCVAGALRRRPPAAAGAAGAARRRPRRRSRPDPTGRSAADPDAVAGPAAGLPPPPLPLGAAARARPDRPAALVAPASVRRRPPPPRFDLARGGHAHRPCSWWRRRRRSTNPWSSPRLARRSAICTQRSSRSFIMQSTGEAMKIDE